MTTVNTRIRVGPDGTLSGRVEGLPAGEHDAEITLVKPAIKPSKLDADDLLAQVRNIQAELARLPVLDNRSADEILGYNARGHFD